MIRNSSARTIYWFEDKVVSNHINLIAQSTTGSRRLLYNFCISVLFCCLLSACARKPIGPFQPVGATFIDSPTSGLIRLRVDGFGKSISRAEENAVSAAFLAIIFRGIPEFTALNRPLVSSESKFNSENPGWFQNFIESGTYQRFINKDYGIQELEVKKGRRVSRELTINYQALRRYLEEEGVVRKFGY